MVLYVHTMSYIKSTLSVLSFYRSMVRPYKKMAILVVMSSATATLLYFVLAPYLIALIVDYVANTGDKSWQTLVPLVTTYAGILIIGDVIAWRIVDFCQWAIEDRLSRTDNRRAKAFIKLSDTITYQTIPLLSGILGSCLLIFLNGSTLLAFSILIFAFLFILLTPRLTRGLFVAEARYDAKLITFATLNRAHTIQQTIIKLLLVIFSVGILSMVAMQVIDAKISLGVGVMSLLFGASLSRQLFTFSNNSIKNYRACL